MAPRAGTADLEAAEARLAAARRQGEPDELAEALAVHANALVRRGQLAPARGEIDEVVELHRGRGRAADEARYAVLAATLCRLLRQLPEARTRAQRAAALAVPGSPVSVAAATALGEIALAEGDGPAAADAFGRALAEGERAGAAPAARVAVLRKRATALVKSNRYQEAAQDLAAAHDLAAAAGDRALAIRALVEQATALQQGHDAAGAERVRRQAVTLAAPAGDHGALAELSLLEATQAVERRDAAAAMAAARAARTQALAAVAPVQYLSAAIAIAELADAAGDRLAAYEALATGWATLGDLLGREAARLAFEPKLLALREKWGPAAFAEIKAAYEAHRRAESARRAAPPGE